jgi:large subunit ribosomal protein L3
MISSLLGTKSHMDQAFTIAGHRVGFTVVKTGANIVTQVKTQEKNGFSAIQIGWGSRKAKSTPKPLQGHFKNLNNKDTYPRHLKDIKTDEAFEAGATITPAQVFQEGDLVKVTGVSKGKGFAGGMKRWGFAGGPKTHGQSDRHRAPGSIGQGTTPGRVHKGKKMAGHMGQDQVTTKNLTVLKVDDKQGVMWLSGAVPGASGGLLLIQKIGQDKKFQPLYTEDVPEEVVEQAMEAAAEEEAANKPVVEEDPAEGSAESEVPKDEAQKLEEEAK